jgi:hypothetical protein
MLRAWASILLIDSQDERGAVLQWSRLSSSSSSPCLAKAGVASIAVNPIVRTSLESVMVDLLLVFQWFANPARLRMTGPVRRLSAFCQPE